jgi:hypothetical protein
VLSVAVASTSPSPDLTVSDAFWLDEQTLAYPIDRLPAGIDPEWLRFRLHWGDLAVDATSIGGESTLLRLVDGAPDGYLALELDKHLAHRRHRIVGSAMVAIGVYDDAHRLIDATGVAPPS